MSKTSGGADREAGRLPLTPGDFAREEVREPQADLVGDEGHLATRMEFAQSPLFPDETVDMTGDDGELAEPDMWEIEIESERLRDDGVIDSVAIDESPEDTEDVWGPAQDSDGSDLEWDEFTGVSDRFGVTTGRFAANASDMSSFFHRDVEEHLLHRTDPPLVTANQRGWMGPEPLYPPFTVGEFEQALGGLRDIGIGWSGAQHGDIAGQHYVVKEVDGSHTMQAGGFEDDGLYFAEVARPTRYEASAEQCASDIARVMGQADQTVAAFAFEYRDRQFVVSSYVENLEPILAVLHRRTIASEPDREALIEQLADIIVRDYVLGDEDRNGTNFAINPITRRIVALDYARCLRYEGDLLLQSTAIDLYRAALGNPGSTPIPRSSVERVLNHEEAIVQTVLDHHLEPGIWGVQMRMRTLQKLLETNNDVRLEDIGTVRHFTGWRANNENGHS